MKILDLLEKATRADDKIRVQNAPRTDVDGFYSTSAAAKELGVTTGQVRQWILDGRMSAKKPTIGRRDHLIKKSEVARFKKEPRERTGRPDEGKGTSTKDKDKDKD